MVQCDELCCSSFGAQCYCIIVDESAGDADGKGAAEVAVADSGELQFAARTGLVQGLDRQQRCDASERFDRRGDVG